MLTPCLHIIFRGSTAKSLGVTGFALFLALHGKSGGVTFYGPLINCKNRGAITSQTAPNKSRTSCLTNDLRKLINHCNHCIFKTMCRLCGGTIFLS